MSSASNSKPLWIDDEPSIQKLLHDFLDKIDRNQSRISIKISLKTVPALFDYGNDTAYLWSLIKDLEEVHQILAIRHKSKSKAPDEYDNFCLDFNREQEALVRDWLNRPSKYQYSEEWASAVDDIQSRFKVGDIEALRANSLYSKNKSAISIVGGILRVSEILSKSDTMITIKQLSARSFWGDSKFLDGKEDVIHRIFPDQSHQILPRKILIEASIPSTISKILFIENLDTFLNLVDNRSTIPSLAQAALIFSAGFKGSSARLREPGHVTFSYVSPLPESPLSDFLNIWFMVSEERLPVYFWGDLDYSGMGILAALRKIFLTCQAWQPGYRAMLELTTLTLSHSLEDAGKDDQKDPIITGCNFADDILLPYMRETGKFLDQEAVDTDSIIEFGERNHVDTIGDY